MYLLSVCNGWCIVVGCITNQAYRCFILHFIILESGKDCGFMCGFVSCVDTYQHVTSLLIFKAVVWIRWVETISANIVKCTF